MEDLGSISWGIDPKCTFLSGLVLLFLYLGLQILKLLLPTFKRNKDIQKPQGTKRRRNGMFKGRRSCRREAEEGRKLLSILKSPLGQRSDKIYFRHLLCPDPLCGVCNRTTAKVSQLLCKASLEDAAYSVSQVPSITSVEESSVFLSAVVSAISPGASTSAPLPEAIPPGASTSAPLPEAIPPGASTLAPLPEAIPPGASTSAPLPEAIPPGASTSAPLPEETPPGASTSAPLPEETPPGASTSAPLPEEIPPGASTSAPLPEEIPPGASTSAPLPEEIPPGASTSAPLPEEIPPGASTSAPLPEAIPPGASTSAPLPEQTPLPSSALSVDQVTSLTDLGLPSSRVDSLTTEPVPPLSSELPVDHSPSQTPAPTPALPHDSQEAQSALQPAGTLFLGDGPGGSTIKAPMTRTTEGASGGVSELSTGHAHIEKLTPSKLEHSQKKNLPECLSKLVEPGDLPFLSPDVLLLLERQIKKKGDFLMEKEKKKKTKSFPKELKPDCQLNSSEKVLESVADQQDSPVSVPSQSSKDKSEELQAHHQTPYPKSFEDPFPQFFWGLPSLHSESLSPKVPVSGDCSTHVYFNTMSNATTADKSPVLPHPAPLSLPEIQSQPLTQTLSRSQSQHHPTPVPPQDQLQVSVPILPPPSLMPSEIQDLEYNVLQKRQESMWGLPSVVQKSREDFCPPAPKLLLDRQSSKAFVPTSILLGDFPLKKELRKKLEHHLRKRLIQHRWGLPRRVHESLSGMIPQTEVSEPAESKSSYGLSWISLFRGQSSRELQLSQPRSFHERNSELLPLEERAKKINSAEIGTKGCPKWAAESSSQKQLTDALEGHLSKKFEEINESQMPGSVHRSWHSMEELLSCPKKPRSQMKHNLATLLGEDNCLNTSQDISFLGSKKQKMLEDHIKVFHKRLMCGLPHKVQESIEIFNTKGTPSWSSIQSKVPSSSSLISSEDSKPEVSKPLKGGFNTLHGDKVEPTNSVPTVDPPLAATSTVSKESKRVLRHSHPHTSHELTENVKKIEADRQSFLPCQRSDIDKESQKQTVITSKCTPKLPTRQAGARPKSWNKGACPNNSIEKPQRKIIKNLEYIPMFNKSREIFKAKELCTIRSKSTKSLMTMESESFSVIDVTMSQVGTTLVTERPPEGISAPKDSESLDLKNQLLNELKFKMESREHGLAPGFSTDLSLAFDNLTSKTFLTHLQSASSGDKAASQVLQAHLEKKGISIEQGQEPWIPTHVLCKCQDKNLPLAPNRVCPLSPKTGEFGGGDAGLGTTQPRRRPHHTQDRTLKEALGNKTSPAPSLKGQLPPEKFRYHIKHLFQWLCPTLKTKGQGVSLTKGSSSSSVQGRNLIKERAAITGNTEAQKIMTDIGKVLEDKLAGRHGVEVCAPQKPPSTLMKSGKIQHKAGPLVQAEPVQKHAFNLKTPCSKVPGTKSSSQEVGLIGQKNPTRNRWVMERGRQPQKSVTLQDKLLCQRHHPPMPYKEPMLHPSTTCRCRVGQVPPATPTFAKGSLLGDLSLLCKQKLLLQNLQGEKFLPPK